MEKDLINLSEAVSEEITLPNIEWDDYLGEDFCVTKCVYFDKCSGKREHCVKKAFDDIMKTLTPREEMVLKLRWGFYKNKRFTLEDVAQCLNVTRERVRQIEAKAFRKLRHPSRVVRLTNGVAITAESSSEFYEKLVAGILAKKENIDTSATKIEICETTAIEGIGLSVRAYYYLKRAQFSTVSDLLAKKVIDILRIKHLGPKTTLEILSKLDELGFRLADCSKDKYPDVKVKVYECWEMILKESEEA